MKTNRFAQSLVLSFLLLALAAGAGVAAPTADIKILAPADGSKIDAGEAYSLKYEVALGPGDDHFHVWVDGDRSPGIHDLKGTYALPKLSPGEHVITIKLVDKGHVPTGPEKTIKVHAK
jgi:hypothetical protein